MKIFLVLFLTLFAISFSNGQNEISLETINADNYEDKLLFTTFSPFQKSPCSDTYSAFTSLALSMNINYFSSFAINPKSLNINSFKNNLIIDKYNNWQIEKFNDENMTFIFSSLDNGIKSQYNYGGYVDGMSKKIELNKIGAVLVEFNHLNQNWKYNSYKTYLSFLHYLNMYGRKYKISFTEKKSKNDVLIIEEKDFETNRKYFIIVKLLKTYAKEEELGLYDGFIFFNYTTQ